MKKLKSTDLPDLVKTVRSKKLPPQALKSIAPHLRLNEGNIELVEPLADLKAEAKTVFD